MIPVDPGADEARDWLARELAEPAYREATPSWFDTLFSDFFDWLNDLIGAGSGSPSVLVLLLVVLLLAGLVVAAYFIFGAPRANRRSRAAGALFGEEDARDAAAIRRAAEQAAAGGDWALAIEEMFRSIARGLADRSVLSTTPGTTASGFASAAAPFFPAVAGELAASAVSFDDVRYLDRPGTEGAYTRVAELERTIRDAKPAFDLVAR